jgi:glycine/D-amino acid oxidase-like deaminating enzyme
MDTTYPLLRFFLRACDVIVVGGGIAGLIAAAFAAKRGASVQLLESSSDCGGRAQTRVVSGYYFNQGAHALYRDGFFDTALRDLGLTPTGNTPALARGFFVKDKVLHPAPFSEAGLASTTLLSEVERHELAALLSRLRDRDVDLPPGTPLQDGLAALAQSSAVRAVLSAMIRLTSLIQAPSLADARALLEQLRGGLVRNVLYLDGGWGAAIDGLRLACLAFGVRLRTGCRVASVENGNSWQALLIDGTVLRARSLILAVDAAQAAALYPGLQMTHGPKGPVPARVACLDLGLAGLPRPEVLFALGVDNALYFSVHSAAASMAPDGCALIHTMRYLEPGEKPGGRRVIAELEEFMDLLQPGWREFEQARQVLFAMPAISSIPLAARCGMNGRPRIAIQNADGLFLCGDWVGNAGMLADAAAASGRSAGEAAAEFAQQ